MTARLVIAVCWTIFLIYWAVTALPVKAIAERQNLGARAWHLGLLLVAVLFMANAWLNWPANMNTVPHGVEADIVGALLCVLGLVCAIWARRTLAGNWSSSVAFKQGHELIVRGPYKYARHPIYSGILLMVFGSAAVSGRFDAFIGAFALFGSFWIKLRQEEALMMRHFPETYSAYKRQVKMFLPFVW